MDVADGGQGPHCANGGTALRSGADRNGNGALGDDEIERTDYVCDPTTAVLIRRDPLAPDATARCANHRR